MNVPKADPGVHGILTAIGGFNSNELLPHLDWDLIAQNPKVVCGYSDITSSKTPCLPHRSGDLLPPTLVHLRDAVARMALAMREEVAIMLPLVRPGLAAVAIFTATQAWNEFLFGLTMTTGALPRR